MARNLELSTPDFLSWDGTPGVTTVPLTMSCWMWLESSTNYGYGLWLGDELYPNAFYGIGTDSSGNAFMIVSTFGGYTITSSTAGMADGVWGHVSASFVSGTSRTVYFNGANSASSVVDRTFGSNPATRISIGMARDSSPAFPHDGGIAEPAIWNVALNLDEIQALARGTSPLRVRPSSLKHYWPLRNSDKDMIGAADMSTGGSPTWHDSHSPIRQLRGPRMVTPEAEAPPAGTSRFSFWVN